MQYTTLGRTGLKVSVAGLGGGGGSQLGLDRGKTRAEAQSLVRLAYDLGVTVFDTAHSYMTEEVLGEALQGIPRASVVLCTKHNVSPSGGRRELHSPAEMVEGLDLSLRRLRTDHVDVFYLHSLTLPNVDYALNEIVPVLLREKAKGKFRFLGVTETPIKELEHQGMRAALKSDVFDVAMVAFQLLHQNARTLVFPQTMSADVGTVLMFAVRNIFAKWDHLRDTFQRLAREGKVPAHLAAKDNPLDFLIHTGGARSLIDAAYRFARHEPGVDLVLFGTGDPAHLRENITSITAPALPESDLALVRKLFGELVGEGLDIPNRVRSKNA